MRDHFAGGPAERVAAERVEPDVQPVIVTFSEDAARLAAYRDHLALDLPLLVDTDRMLYQLLGAQRTSMRNVWNPGTIAQYVRLVVQGRRLRRPREDTLQLGADAIVDGEGRLRRVWLPTSPDARPPISELADAVHEVG
ncbi:MAG: hypothetical protein QNM02_21730 [Acidimicrobiia bacterium]|nr:hypothetical protein [Acidimicrobiia bacterium]